MAQYNTDVTLKGNGDYVLIIRNTKQALRLLKGDMIHQDQVDMFIEKTLDELNLTYERDEC